MFWLQTNVNDLYIILNIFPPHRCRTVVNPEDVNKIDEIQDSMKERSNVFFEMEAFLPKKNE